MKKLVILLTFCFLFFSFLVSNPVKAEDKSKCSQNGLNYGKSFIISSDEYPCPSGYVYCEHYRCPQAFCCPWGYFYSNSCTCECYRSLEDARADCPDGAVFQCR